MAAIDTVHAREVFDSRGKPTLEVEIGCGGWRPRRAIVPSGASTGRSEAAELRDGDPRRLGGAGVLNAVKNINGEIAAAVKGRDACDQQGLDRALCELDGTPNKSRLGANAILGVSLAAAYASAEAQQKSAFQRFREIWNTVPSKLGAQAARTDNSQLGRQPCLPLPMINMISGGLHAGGNLDFQDFMIVPVGAESFRQAMEWAVEVYRRLGRLLTGRGYEGRLIADEGGFGPRLESNSAAVESTLSAIESAGLRPEHDVAVALDIAATHFYRDGRYRLSVGEEESLSAEELIDVLETWVNNFPIVSIEDALGEEDWLGWARLTDRLGRRVQLVGDDLFVTNSARLQRGIDQGAANSVLVKLNQIGTLWETLETVRLALDSGYRPVVSARSGETEDTTLADLTVAIGTGQIKVGSVARSERLCKYNQLLRLEERLGDEAVFAGRSALGQNGS